MKIRHASLADLDRISQIERESFPPLEGASRESIRGRIEAFGDHFWLLETDQGDIASFVNGFVIDLADLTDPMVLRQVIADCQDQGRAGLVLTCKEKLIHYYAKFGFVNEGISQSVHGNVTWYQMRRTF